MKLNWRGYWHCHPGNLWTVAAGEMGHQTQRSLMACPWDRSCANNSLVMRIASRSSRECNELLCNRTLPFCQISGLIHVKAVRFEHFEDDNFIRTVLEKTDYVSVGKGVHK